MSVRGDHILIADLVKSMSLLCFQPSSNTIDEIARDYDANWMTACETLSDNVFIGSDNCFNLFTLQRNLEGVSEEDRARLDCVGRYHSGEFINRIRAGSLVMNIPGSDNDSAVIPTHLFGTINGVVGVIAPLSKVQYEFLLRLEECLQDHIRGVGGFSHKQWRTFVNERREESKCNFIDGDLIESLLDAPQAVLDKVCHRLEIGASDLVKRVEDLSRIH